MAIEIERRLKATATRGTERRYQNPAAVSVSESLREMPWSGAFRIPYGPPIRIHPS